MSKILVNIDYVKVATWIKFAKYSHNKNKIDNVMFAVDKIEHLLDTAVNEKNAVELEEKRKLLEGGY